MNFQMLKAGFRKGRGTKDQIASICWITEKAREFQKNIYFQEVCVFEIHPKMRFPLHLCCLCLHCEYLSPLICGVLLSEKGFEDTIRSLRLPCFMIHTLKAFGIVNKAEIDVSLELSCCLHDPADVGNLISGSSAFSKTSLNIWKFTVHVLWKPGLENFDHYFGSE